MVSLAGVQVAPCAVYALPSGRRQTCLQGEKHVFSKTNWKMGQQGRLNCDNLKWLCMVPLLGKQKQSRAQEFFFLSFFFFKNHLIQL